MPEKKFNRTTPRAFTLLELLVSASVFTLLLTLMVGVIKQASFTIRQASAQISTFASARSAFDALAQRLAQVTLNTYWAYDNAEAPTRYMRQSDLHFVIQKNTGYGQAVFFQCPEAYSTDTAYRSAPGLLNICGYRVVYGSDALSRPAVVENIVPLRWRFRLMQTLQSAENFSVYTESAADSPAWIPSGTALQQVEKPLADNIIALIVWPRYALESDAQGTALTQDFTYNSRTNANAEPQPVTAHQLPPVIQVTVVALDEASAARMDTHGSTPPADIANALAGRFADVSQYQSDLDALSKQLTAKKIHFQIFTTSVIPREAKWSP